MDLIAIMDILCGFFFIYNSVVVYFHLPYKAKQYKRTDMFFFRFLWLYSIRIDNRLIMLNY